MHVATQYRDPRTKVHQVSTGQTLNAAKFRHALTKKGCQIYAFKEF